MIFNLSQGGVAYLSVTAPTGATITASCLGLEKTGTGTCVLEAPIIGTWHIVCVFDNTEKTADVDVEVYGETYSTTFVYTAIISIATHPNAAITATKSGFDNLTGTADANGECSLTVPAGGLGIWRVTANNGATTDFEDVDVTAYDTDFHINLLEYVPYIEFDFDGTKRAYSGAAIDYANQVKAVPDGTGWKVWIRASCSVTFKILPSTVDLFVVGKGGNGGSYHYSSATDYGGNGGGGGGIVQKDAQSLLANTAYAVTIGGTTSFGDLVSIGTGTGAAGGGGGQFYWVWSPPGIGGRGKYAFDGTSDNSFDGIEYGHGGEGGDVNAGSGQRGRTTGVYANPGAGGAGGGQGNPEGSQPPTSGRLGIVIMRATP